MHQPTVSDIRAEQQRYEQLPQERRDFAAFVAKLIDADSIKPRLQLTPHQRKIMDGILDETRKHNIQVVIQKAPMRARHLV